MIVNTNTSSGSSGKPDMSFWNLWNLSFGFFGVQIAYALQSSQVSRIFSTIGADPHDLSYFWILPPLMGLIVQPIIGSASDKTWNRFGRRLPYLILGAAIAMIVMCFLPNSGSLGLGVSSAIMFGLVMLMLLDTSINMAMQPFKMLVGDMVNEKQKGLAYSLQSLLCNAGSVVGYVTPFILGWFLAKTAPQGEVPPTVIWAFYIGAFVLLLCVIYTLVKVKEWPPELYDRYNGIEHKDPKVKEKSENMFKLLAKAPKVFWTVGVVQFFCWAAFLYMWTYSTDGIAGHAFHAPAVQKVTGVKVNGVDYNDNYLFAGQQPIIEKGRFSLMGINVDGEFCQPNTVVMDNDTLIRDGQLVYREGQPLAKISEKPEQFASAGKTIKIDNKEVTVGNKAEIVSAYSAIAPDMALTLAHICAKDHATGQYVLEQTTALPSVKPTDIAVNYTTVLNTESSQYQGAGDWNGVLLAIQGVVAALWAMVLPRFRNRRTAYSVSLLIGAVGFLSIYFLNTKGLLCISYGLAGCAWAAMLAMPFTILTNALSGKNIGTYMGLFNGTITIPQIIAALVGGIILSWFPVSEQGVTQTVFMLLTSGVLLILGALSVWIVRETSGEKERQHHE